MIGRVLTCVGDFELFSEMTGCRPPHPQGAQWKSLTLLTAFLYPGLVFILFFVLNFFIWGRGSSGAVPFGTIVALICMWFCISVPLVFLGAFFGFKQVFAPHTHHIQPRCSHFIPCVLHCFIS